MKVKLIATIFLGALFIFGTLWGYAQEIKQVPTKTYSSSDNLQLINYYPNQFNKTINLSGQLSKTFTNNEISAGIIPHDITHGEYIAHFFNNLKKQNPKKIILIGPNHFELGSSRIITTAKNWSTPYGIVKADQNNIQKLLENPAIIENNQVVENEHSISGIVPYIAYYLPQVEITPLILKAELSLNDIGILNDIINTKLDDDIMIVASVDFSHYLTSGQAVNRDLVTQKALAEFDYRKIMSFGPSFNDYLDSPPTIALLLKWLESNNIKNNKILYNTNSGILSNNFSDPVTSYFEMIYYK